MNQEENDNLNKYPWKWLLASYCWLSILIGGCLYLTKYPPEANGFLDILTKNFNGNMFAGILTSIYFVFLGLHLNSQNDNNLENIRQIIERWKRERDSERIYQRFLDFLKDETYHDVRFPEIKSTAECIGLSYTIEPVREVKTGKLVVKKSEMKTHYLIKVLPLDQSIRDWPEQIIKYQNSPIREDEYYFCEFYNGSWHMSSDDIGSPVYKFNLSGKVGPVESSYNANVYALSSVFQTKYTEVGQLLINESGAPANLIEEHVVVILLLKDNEGNYFIKIDYSPAKKVYYTNPKNSFKTDDYFFYIENLGGYGSPEVRKILAHSVEDRFRELSIKVPSVPWYKITS